MQVCLGLVSCSLACITNYGTIQLEFAARPGRFCMRSGRPGKRSKEPSFFSQEEKMGLWHATKGMCFLGDFGEKGFSKFALQYSGNIELEYIYICCSPEQAAQGFSWPSELHCFLSVSEGTQQRHSPRGWGLISPSCVLARGGGYPLFIAHSCNQGTRQISTVTAPGCALSQYCSSHSSLLESLVVFFYNILK